MEKLKSKKVVGFIIALLIIVTGIGILLFGKLETNIVYFSVQWWRTLHQVQSSPKTIDPEMVLSLRLNAFAFLFILILFIYHRYQIVRLKEEKEDRLK